MIPKFDWNPVEKMVASSLFKNSANSFSNWICRSSVPLRNLDPDTPVPYCSVALTAASITSGCDASPR